MGKSDLMDRVATDLARGRTHPAIQRLHSLIAAHPTDLDLRRRLADVHRSTGNLVAAGRWSYLDEGADPTATAAFERALPSPERRRAALRWPDGAQPPTTHARTVLDALSSVTGGVAASHEPVRPGNASPRWSWMTVGAGVLIAGFAALGLATVVSWLIA